MKSVEQIVQKREELRQKRDEHVDKIDKLKNELWYNLSREEKREYSDLCTIVMSLNVQIDALTYVINYDSDLKDVTAPRTMVSSRDKGE